MPAKKSAVHLFAHEAMATVFEIFIAGREKAYAGQAARAAFDEIDRLERLFSRFDPSSEISRDRTARAGRVAAGRARDGRGPWAFILRPVRNRGRFRHRLSRAGKGRRRPEAVPAAAADVAPPDRHGRPGLRGDQAPAQGPGEPPRARPRPRGRRQGLCSRRRPGRAARLDRRERPPARRNEHGPGRRTRSGGKRAGTGLAGRRGIDGRRRRRGRAASSSATAP